MKASIKFRDEQKPLLRAKIPLNIVNFPFQSAVSAGESKELALSLSTAFFDSGPSVKFSYRPNDPHKPFAVVFKTGVGQYKSPLIMSAEFNPIGGAQNPSFSIHFKPNLGNFFAKKSHSSYGLTKKLDGFIENDYFNTANGFSAPSFDGLAKGWELGAKTTATLRGFASVNFRWGLRFPEAEEAGDMVVVGRKAGVTAGEFFGKSYNYRLPYLVMNKIGIELSVAKEKVKKDDPNGKLGDVAEEAYLDVKKQIDAIRGENAMLGRALGDLRSDLGVEKAETFSSEWQRGNKNAAGCGDRKGNGDVNSMGVIDSS